MNLPRYFICKNKAVKLEKINDSEVAVLVYDNNLKKFIEDIDFLDFIYSSYDSEEVTEDEFNKFIASLKND